MLKLLITDENAHQRLDKAIADLVGSRSRAEHLIKNNHVHVNQQILAKSSYKTKAGDVIEVSVPIEPQTDSIEPLDLKLDVVFEDDDVIVINKPAGLVVHPAAGHAQDTLVNALVHHTKNLSMKFGQNRPGIVHRLDKDTSGLLVVAKNDFAHENLAQQFKQRSVHRIYYALCIGHQRETSGVIKSYLSRHPVDRKRNSSVLDRDKKIIREKIENFQSGKWAVTNYEIIKKPAIHLFYVRLKLETGRTHQIRVHMSEIGMPVAGDETYGADKKLRLITSALMRKAIAEFPRLALHAAELGFDHPKSGKRLEFKADWPEDLRPSLERLHCF